MCVMEVSVIRIGINNQKSLLGVLYTCKQAPQPTAWNAAGRESKADSLHGQSYNQRTEQLALHKFTFRPLSDKSGPI